MHAYMHTYICTQLVSTRHVYVRMRMGDLTVSSWRTSTTASRPRSLLGSSAHGVDGVLNCRRAC